MGNKLFYTKIMVLLLFTKMAAWSQVAVKGIVNDSISGKAIPYVNIWIYNENTGTSADAEGRFTVTSDNSKILVLSAVGYESKKIKVTDAAMVLLQPIIITLDEVVIARKGNEKITLGKYNKNKVNFYFSCGKSPWIVARYFAPSEANAKTPFLKELTIMTDSNIEGAQFNVRFFGLDQNGNPGEDLAGQNIIMTAAKGKHDTSIDLEPYGLRFPADGFFVAVEWLIIPENKYSSKVQVNKDNTELRDYISYEPSIGTAPSDRSITWLYTKGQWRQKVDKTAIQNKKEFEELAMKLILTN